MQANLDLLKTAKRVGKLAKREETMLTDGVTTR
jgi:hypothetical protein